MVETQYCGMTMRAHTQVVNCLSTTETSSPTPPCIQPGYYFLFLQLLREIITTAFANQQSPEFFADGIRQLVRRYQLCVDRDGDYVEKINMRCVAEVSSFNLMYHLCGYYEKLKSYDKTELTFQPTLVHFPVQNAPNHKSFFPFKSALIKFNKLLRLSQFLR